MADTQAKNPSEETLNDLRDTIATATYLGVEVAAIAGTTAVEVIVHGWEYDDPDSSIGMFQNKDAAVIALRNWVVERHDEMEDSAPWTLDMADTDFSDDSTYDRAYQSARTAWLTKTDDEIIESMFDESMYEFVYHKIEANPTRLL